MALTLNLDGFDVHSAQAKFGKNQETVDFAAHVLLKSNIPVTVQNIQNCLKQVFGRGISNGDCTALLKEWKSQNLKSIKAVKPAGGVLETVEELLKNYVPHDLEIPEEFKSTFEKIFRLVYWQAYSTADMEISGDRLQELARENDTLKAQVADYPRIKWERDHYFGENEKLSRELKEAYFSLDKQKLSEAEEVQKRIDLISEKNAELTAKNQQLEESLAKAVLNQSEKELNAQIAVLQGNIAQLTTAKEQAEAEVLELRRVQGEKQVMESERDELRSQLNEKNQLITNLQAQLSKAAPQELQVDVDAEELQLEVEQLRAELAKYRRAA